MDNQMVPDRDSLIQALRLVARASDGQPLDLPDKNFLHTDAQLVGMLDAAIGALAQRFTRGVGKGNTQRLHVVKGHKLYLQLAGQSTDWMSFFQERIERLAADMKTAIADDRLAGPR